MASRGLLIPPAYVPYIANAAAGVSLVPIIAGTYGLLNPAAGFSLLHFQSVSDPKDRRLAHGIFRMYAVRQVFLGLGTLALWWTGSYRAWGLTSLGGGLVAIVDGLVAKQVSGEHVAGHWVGVGLSMLYAGTFLGAL